MIEINNVDIHGFRNAIRAMRMPFESWEKSDSYEQDGKFIFGENDKKLALRLLKGGEEHRKAPMQYIHVYAEIKAPRSWWQQFDTYKFVTKTSSSTMHLLMKRLLTKEDFSVSNKYTEGMLSQTLLLLNSLISRYKSQNAKDKDLFIATKELLPESFLQLRAVDLDYEVLLRIYKQRRNHKLPEWGTFCNWITTLPYMDEFLENLCQQKKN